MDVQLISETFLVSNAPRSILKNHSFNEVVINGFKAKMSDIKELADNLISFYITIEKTQSETAIKWLNANAKYFSKTAFKIDFYYYNGSKEWSEIVDGEDMSDAKATFEYGRAKTNIVDITPVDY